MMPYSKTVLVTALFMTLPAVAVGQSTLGFRGGLSLTSLGGRQTEGFETRTGISFGGFFNVPVSDVLGVQVGAGFVQKGASFSGWVIPADPGFEVPSFDLEFEMGFIEIPLLLTLSLPTVGNVGFTFSVGPVVGFETGCNTSLSGGVTVELDCHDPMSESDLKFFEVGAMVGAGLEIGLTESVSLILDGLYNVGLPTTSGSGIVDDTKNRALSILAGVSFSLGG